MKHPLLLSAIAVIAALTALSFYKGNRSAVSGRRIEAPVIQPVSKPDTAQAKIQIVFALDATGSMSGLIGAAKEKIWSIAGSLAQADPAPRIEMGLIFYR